MVEAEEDDRSCADPADVFEVPAQVHPTSYCTSVATADFNGDGLSDLVHTTSSYATTPGAVTVHLGNGAAGLDDGHFGPPSSEYFIGHEPRSVIVADFNEDGILDLAAANASGSTSGSTISHLIGRGVGGVGDGTFASPAQYPIDAIPARMAAVDVNDDANLDLVVTDARPAGRFWVFPGRSDGTFGTTRSHAAAPDSDASSAGLQVADLNEDGIEDLAICAYNKDYVSVVFGSGGGVFGVPVAYRVGRAPVRLAAADFNHDGVTDLACTLEGDRSVAILLGRGEGGVGDGSFESPTKIPLGFPLRGIVVADFDRDGMDDLVVGMWVRSFLLLPGRGDGTFGPAVSFETVGNSSDLCVGDFSSDGRPDLAVVGLGLGVHPSQCGLSRWPPIVTGFSSAGGNVGDPTTLRGARLLGATEVRFNGVPATIHSAAPSKITTLIPEGATTGPVTVVTQGGASTSADSFIVDEAPRINEAIPDTGWRTRTIVMRGTRMSGVTRVAFGPAGSASFTINSDQQITAILDSGATSGPIAIVTPRGTGLSRFDFVVVPIPGSEGLWSRWDPPGGPPRPLEGASTAFDQVRHRLLVFGGKVNSTLSNDTWALELGSSPRWTRLALAGTHPSPRFDHGAIYDPVHDRMLVFGGTADGYLGDQILSPNQQSDTWALSLGDSSSWSPIVTPAPQPLRRSDMAVAHDPSRNRLIVVGGSSYRDGDCCGGGISLAAFPLDSWALDLDRPEWVQLGRTAYAGNAVIHDPIHDRLVAFGGYWRRFDGCERDGKYCIGGHSTMTSSATAGLTLRSGTTWEEIPLDVRPSRRTQHSAVYDQMRRRMLVYGGQGEGRLDDLWQLDLGGAEGWRPIHTLNRGPHWAEGHGAVFDPRGDAMWVFNPQHDGSVWKLSFDSPTQVLISTASARVREDGVELVWLIAHNTGGVGVERRATTTSWQSIGAVVPDGTGRVVFVDRRVEAGSRYAYRLALTTKAGVEYGSEVWVDVPAIRLRLAGTRPNPSRSRLTVSLSLPDASPATLEAFDVTGRRVATRAVGGMGAGNHLVEMPSDRPLRPGLYLLRLIHGRERLAARAVVVN